MKSVFKPSHLRIKDILLIEDHDEDEEEDHQDEGDSLLMDGCTGVLPRCLSRFRRLKVNRTSLQNDRRVQNAAEDSTDVDVINGDDPFTTEPQNHQSGCWRDSSFNVGVGCCLLYLIAASKNELDKMEKLRTQMEMLLQNAKKELKMEDTFINPFESNDIFAYSTTDVGGLESNCHLSPLNNGTPCVLLESSTVLVCDESLNSDTPRSEQCLEGMDQLEAELEAELERFLWQHPQEQRLKVTVEDTDSPRRQNLSSGEVIDPQEGYTEVNCGVPPNELERRLHEVLEARQQEQIRELEAALEYARHKLHEKEMEVSWWKDTAKRISQHIAGPSRLITEHDDQEKYHLR